MADGTTPTPRWTTDERAVIDRIARHIWPSGGNGQVPTNAPEEIFEDLKRAGVLTPVGGETRQEIEVQTAGLRYPCSDMPRAWRQFGELKAKNYDARIVQRDVWVGPWREVTDGD
jgi:hypothetical protein